MAKNYVYIKTVSVILRIIWYLQIVFLVGIIIFAVLIVTKSTWINTEKLAGFHVQFSKIELPQSDESLKKIGSQAYITNGEGRLHLKNVDSRFILFRLISVFVDAFIYALIIYFLKKIFSGLKEGIFFTAKNGEYIKKIAYAVLSFALIPDFINYLLNVYFSNHLEIDGILLKARYNFDIQTTFLALLIFVIARTFIKGAELKEEIDLTI